MLDFISGCLVWGGGEGGGEARIRYSIMFLIFSNRYVDYYLVYIHFSFSSYLRNR